MSKLIVNCETGEETLRELSKPEKDQKKIDEALDLQIQAELQTKANERLAIAERLGLTADELKILLG